MKVYKVKVNGKVYEVELESVSEVKGSIAAPQAPASAPAPAPVASGEGTPVKAPIAGKVLSVKVKVGDTVKVNQTVASIEAMKLENDVPATAAGVVKEIKVSEGANVNNGDVLIVLG